MIESLLDAFLNMDQNITLVVQEYGMVTYLILFLIIFFETGFVIFPFLPGDSLLFVGGAAAASGILDLWALIIVIVLGAIIGDTVNYWIGHYVGIHLFLERFPTLVKREYIDRTYEFYYRYVVVTIFVDGFVPFVRTFAPFLAGVGTMHYRRFIFYNVLVAVCWPVGLGLAGYFFVTLAVGEENMSLLIIGVMILTGGTLAYIGFLLIKGWRERRHAAP